MWIMSTHCISTCRCTMCYSSQYYRLSLVWYTWKHCPMQRWGWSEHELQKVVVRWWLPPGPQVLQTLQSRCVGPLSGKCCPLRRPSVWSWLEGWWWVVVSYRGSQRVSTSPRWYSLCDNFLWASVCLTYGIWVYNYSFHHPKEDLTPSPDRLTGVLVIGHSLV